MPAPSRAAAIAAKKTNRRIRPARISSGGLRSASCLAGRVRDCCFGTDGRLLRRGYGCNGTVLRDDSSRRRARLARCFRPRAETISHQTVLESERDSTVNFAIVRMRAPTRETRALPRSASKAHRANQSPPLKPTEPKHAEQPTRDGRRLRNSRPIYLNIIDYILEIGAIGLSVEKLQPYEEVRHPDGTTRT